MHQPGQNNTANDCRKPSSNFSITHIITAASIFHINDVNFLTDPFFSPNGTEFPVAPPNVITVLQDPAMSPDQVPPIDAVLLSHEDHPDNLDPIGRAHFLDGHKVLTTPDGARNLYPRPGVTSLQSWQTIPLHVGGETWNVTGTPCVHLPGGEVVGFVLRGPGFGYTDGLPNAIWYSGDTVYIKEVSQLKDMFHLRAAVFNMGAAVAASPDGTESQRITMNGTEVAQMFKDVGADILVPMHFNPWSHFTESVEQVRKDFEEAGVSDKVTWLVPGQRTRIF
jgi:L-ascorbate metabolism protein UlaG (beta-lactamase superfamily)